MWDLLGRAVYGRVCGEGQEVGFDHMEWNKKSDKFVTTGPAPAPLMPVRVKVLSQVQKQFVGRKAGLWAQLGSVRSVKESSLNGTGLE